MANIMEQYSSTIITIFQSVINNYEKDLERLKEIQDELEDFKHEKEFGDPKNMYQAWLERQSERELLIERRRCKEEIEILKETYEFFKSQQAQSFKNKIQQLQGNATKLRAIQDGAYSPRRRDNLTLEGKTSTEQKSFEQMIDEFNKNKAYMKKGKMRK